MQQYEDYHGRTVVDSEGEKVGAVSQLYEDTETGKPEWVLVKTGLFGTSETFIPVANSAPEGDQLRVPYTKAQIKDAPNVEAGGQLSTEDEDRLYRHYGFSRSTTRSGSGLPTGGEAPPEGDVRPPSELDRRSMQLREEELQARKQRVQTGEVRLGKDVVTERRQMDVPVTREEVFIERHGVEGRPAEGGEIGKDETISVPVSEERVEVDKQAKVHEEVSLGKQEVEGTHRVEGEVKREQARVDTEGSPGLRDKERNQ